MAHAAAIELGLPPRARKKEDGRMAEPKIGRFRDVARELFVGREEFLTHTGNVNWMLVSEALPDVYYETLRKAVAGDRNPTLSLMEKVAELAGVSPEVFGEYQIAKAQAAFDVKEVGYEAAMENVRRFVDLHAAPPRRKR